MRPTNCLGNLARATLPRVAAATISLLLAGCAAGPNFKPPATNVPAQWVGPNPAPATQPAALEGVLADWWQVFDDPVLTSLIDRAVKSNLDVRLAEARILQARAARRLATSGFGPAVDATGSYTRSQSTGPRPSATGPVTSQYQAGFDAAWEVDLFGRVRRSVEAAGADLTAALEDRNDVLITLAADVARDYVDLRSFQQRIEIARRNLVAQEHSAQLTRQRFEGGFASGLDAANADALVATTASGIPLLEQSAAQTIYSLSLLLGQAPGDLLDELATSAPIPAAPPLVPAGVPSQLLRRRPDIRRAEADIHAATARIGVATADLFPRLTINGSVGFRADDPSAWFRPGGLFWSIGPSANWNLFNTGATRANIDIQKALQDQTLIGYRQTVLAALQEVENALIASVKEQEHRAALVQAVAANRKAVDLSTQLYIEGQTDFLNVLSAQRSLYSAEDSLADSTATVSTNLIALYKALGGGWVLETPP